MISPDAGAFDIEFDWASIPENEWEMLTAIILDTRTPLERMKIVVQRLKNADRLDYRIMNQMPYEDRVKWLKAAGYPWYNSKARYFSYILPKNPSEMSYKEIQLIPGIGPKLASLWMRLVHGVEMPIIDVHVKRWLKARGIESNNYDLLAAAFRGEAQKLGVGIGDLDRQIVKDGIMKRRGLSDDSK